MHVKGSFMLSKSEREDEFLFWSLLLLNANILWAQLEAMSLSL